MSKVFLKEFNFGKMGVIKVGGVKYEYRNWCTNPGRINVC